jgi:hypothetical protein
MVNEQEGKVNHLEGVESFDCNEFVGKEKHDQKKVKANDDVILDF